MKTFYNDLRLIRLSGREEIREPELKLSLTSQTLINIILSEDSPVFVIVIVSVIVIVPVREIFKNEDRDFLRPQTRSPRTRPPPSCPILREKKLTPIFFFGN